MKLLVRLGSFAAMTLLTGCAHAQDHWRDFTECWRADADFGLGLNAGIRVGDLVHVGQGLRFGSTSTWLYGAPCASYKQEITFLFVHAEGRTSKTWREGSPNPQVPDCRGCCFFPLLVNLGGKEEKRSRGALHHADLEVTLFGGCAGLTLGFSPGEFVDFLLGFLGVELDPPDERVGPSEETVFERDR
jgi:hypothetical protein